MLTRPTLLARSAILLVASASLLAFAACNGSVNTNTGGSGGSGGSGPTTSSSTTGGADCSSFDDQPGVHSVTFSFTNQGTAPVFMPGGCTMPAYSLKFLVADGSIEIAYEKDCLQTCQDLQTQGPIECGPCEETVYRIDPGKTLQLTWNGTEVNASTMMPASCYGPGGPQPSCDRIMSAASGDYLLSATVFQQCNGPCTCDTNGLCQGTTAGMSGTTSTHFMLPSDAAAQVTFDGCIFGCP